MNALQEGVSKMPTAEGWLETAIERDPILGPLVPQLRRLAASDVPALIVGEPGTGRELAARAIHNLAGRGPHPFVVLDCVTPSESLLEAEVLGIEGNGVPQKIGTFEQAGAGTVLLRDVGELPPRLQESLLRLLERHELRRLNARSTISTEARCLASTSVDLRARIPSGLFRDDLHARLATEVLVLPPLRERAADVPALAQHFLDQCCTHLPNSAREITRGVEDVLRAYHWPKNLRELQEVIEEAAMRARGEPIGVEHLPERLRGEAQRGPLPPLRDVERRHIERVLQEARGNQRRASRILGISRWSLSRRLRKYGMQVRAES